MKSQETILQELRARRRQLIKDKNWLGALEVINTALTLEPTFDRYYNQGVVLLQLQRVKEAMNSFKKSLELNPHFTKGKDALNKAQQRLQNEMVAQVQNANSAMYTPNEDKRTGDISRETLDMGKASNNANAVEIKKYHNSKMPPLPESRKLSEEIPTGRREKHILEEQLGGKFTDENEVDDSKKYHNSKMPPLPEEGLRIHPIHETNINNIPKPNSSGAEASTSDNSDPTLDFESQSDMSPVKETTGFKESTYITTENTICEDEPLVIADNGQVVTKKYEVLPGDMTIDDVHVQMANSEAKMEKYVDTDAMTIDDVHSQIVTKKHEVDPGDMTIDDVHSQVVGVANKQVATKKYEPGDMTIDDIHSQLPSPTNEEAVTKKYEVDADAMTIDDVHAAFEKPEEKRKTHTYFNDEFINPDEFRD
ncbi:tetratricopeptide repeat protein [Candidatus Uabimicrobium amorphum]|uniref:Uncharacterized protein n=1 Tax=Uabimicrobium amorphum TaxID=2596890 RepID=A0A5S9F244_UABAM|nr:tetratricopeptide repeat protein [Candidatus Uabimicrobium amorphum]BBM83226.1 hypothetical protein UABAM_01577 [Candidatus Uabimicrobium amorphum]